LNLAWKEMMALNLIALTQSDEFRKDSYGYDKSSKLTSLPFIDYVISDKSNYPFLNTLYNDNIGRNWIDDDNDFKVGNSGGILQNIDFVFIGVDVFSEVASFHDKHKTYCFYEKDSVDYKTFWGREHYRRKFGMTANCKLYFKDIKTYFNPTTTEGNKQKLLHPLHITGDHYSYLNYGIIERTPNDAERADLDKRGLFRTKTVESFPRFWDGDYWSYKIDQMAYLNEHSSIIAKARRKGYSYKKGNQTANVVNLNKTVTVINIAQDIKFLTDKGALTYMTKACLDWYENNTYWKRGYLSESLESLELGYKLKHDGNKPHGFKSKVLSYAIGINTSCAVGKKAVIINCEESGKSPKLQEFLDITTSNLESGAISIGVFNVWGTGGTKGANWQTFEGLYYKPSKLNALCFENVWDDDKRHNVCGFFHPQVLNYEPYIVDGNSLLFDSFIIDKKDKDRAKKSKTNEEYTIHCAQRANKPSEAFINTVENLFASPELNVHVGDLKTDYTKQFYTDGWYVKENGTVKFKNKDQCIQEKIIPTGWHDFILDVPHTNATDVHGCVREYYAPYTVNGVITKDLYFIVCDPYGVDKTRSEVTDKHSLYSFQVYMRANEVSPYSGKRLVAEYTGRLNTMKDNDNLLLLACLRWNCSVLVESNRGETISNFKVWKMGDRLLTDPTEYLENSLLIGGKGLKVGMNVGDSNTKLNGLTMIKNFINEVIGIDKDSNPIIRLEEIFSLPLCLEFQRFSIDGNWDRISTMILAMYEFKKDEFVKRYELFNKPNPNQTRGTFFERLNKH